MDTGRAQWREVIAWRHAVSAMLSVNVDCVPSGALAFTITNDHFADFTWGAKTSLGDCVARRFLVYNSSAACTDEENATVVCAPATRASDWRQNDYELLVWKKWELLTEGMDVADAMFYIDSDVTFFANPWPLLRSIDLDIAYQQEVVEGGMNGGQVFVRSKAAAAFAASLRPSVLHNKNKMDQDVVGQALKRTNFMHAPLPLEFLGNCMYAANRSLLTLHTASFHASCAGHKRAKEARMRAVTQHWRSLHRGGFKGPFR